MKHVIGGVILAAIVAAGFYAGYSLTVKFPVSPKAA